jgi:hypothetical protein
MISILRSLLHVASESELEPESDRLSNSYKAPNEPSLKLSNPQPDIELKKCLLHIAALHAFRKYYQIKREFHIPDFLDLIFQQADGIQNVD